MYAPIVLFVYNRPEHTRRTVEALKRCVLSSESDIYIFADGPKENANENLRENIIKVKKYVHEIEGFKSVTIEEASQNKGLAESVISGVSKVIKKYGRAIVVEDDIIAHPFFLRFMNEALECYKERQQIFAISATMEKFAIPTNYKADVFLTYRFGSWGWATWQDRWNSVCWDIDEFPIIQHPTKKQIKDFCRGGEDLWPMLKSQHEGYIDSWAIRFGYNMSLQQKLCLRPTRSFVSNVGMDGSGIHCGNNNVPLLPLYNEDNYSIKCDKKNKLNCKITRRIQYIFGKPTLIEELKYQFKKHFRR